MSAVLEVSNISKRFGGITAVNGVSFDVQEGEILGLIGPNGCGKSTLFNCILGQLTPSDGEVKLDGKKLGNSGVFGGRQIDANLCHGAIMRDGNSGAGRSCVYTKG